MRAIIAIVALAAVFAWYTPMHAAIGRISNLSAQELKQEIAHASSFVATQMHTVREAARTKTMGFLRAELHRSVDALVR